MRTAASWVSVVHPAALIGVEGELERQIKRVQHDAISTALDVLDDQFNTGGYRTTQWKGGYNQARNLIAKLLREYEPDNKPLS